MNNPVKYIDPTGMSPEDDPEKYTPKGLREYVNLFFSTLSSLMGMHPAERYSNDRAIQEEAGRKTENFIETVNAVNETALSIILGGELGYKLITDQEITGEDTAWEVAGIAPFGKLVKGAKVVDKGKTLLNFSKAAASHMDEAGRFVPIQILDDVIKTTKGIPDPKGSRAIMHTIEMVKNGKSYNLDILHDKKTNSIWHFQYSPIKK